MGDRLPAVGILQKLIDRRLPEDTEIAITGVFNLSTQTYLGLSIGRMTRVPYRVEESTWQQLSEGVRLDIVDCADIIASNQEELALQHVEADLVSAIREEVIDGIQYLVRNVVSSTTNNSIFMLRIHGHGNNGFLGISVGTGSMTQRYQAIHQHLTDVELEQLLSPLRPKFSRYGCVQFMHCLSASGNEGMRLLDRVSQVLGVPVTGARETQYAGTTSIVEPGNIFRSSFDTTFYYEGPTYTAFPDDLTLQTWCNSLPDFPECYRH